MGPSFRGRTTGFQSVNRGSIPRGPTNRKVFYMGMFDTVWARCPKCHTEQGLQTKGGVCLLENYPAYKVPLDAAMPLLNPYHYAKDVNGYITCENDDCQALLYVTVNRTLTEYVVVTLHEQIDTGEITREQFE